MAPSMNVTGISVAFVDERDLAALHVDEVTGLKDWISGLALELRGLAVLRIQEFHGDGVFVAVPVDGHDAAGTTPPVSCGRRLCS
jgi:hypothetical protein